MTTIVEATAARLKAAVGEDNLINVGKDASDILGVSATKLILALKYLSDNEGYKTFYLPVGQKDGRSVMIKVLSRPGSKFSDIFKRLSEVQPVKAEKTRKEIAAVGKASKELQKTTTLHNLSSLTLRIRELKSQGKSNVLIGKILGVNESTVRRRLKKPLTAEELHVELQMKALMMVRQDLLYLITAQPSFRDIFGNGLNETYELKINTVKRVGTLVTNEAGEGVRMSFALEFSAIKKPINKENS